VIEVERDALVDAPAAAVWTLVEDTRRLPMWLAFADKIEPLDGGEGPGRRLRLHTRWGSRRAEVDVEVVAFEPGRLLSWRHLEERLGGKPTVRFARETRFSIWIEPEDARTTRVRLHVAQEPAGPIRGLLLRIGGRRELGRRMELSLKRLIMVAPAV
jgi:uncharacterized membrane protein